MSNLENISAKILEEADAQAAEILAQARKEVEELLAQAGQEAQEKRAALLQSAREEAQAIKRRAAADAQMEGKKRILAAKGRLLDEAFEKAGERLAKLDDQAYDALLKKLAKNVQGQIRQLPRDKEQGTGGGFIAVDGKVETNCSFEAILHGMRDGMETALVSILFEA